MFLRLSRGQSGRECRDDTRAQSVPPPLFKALRWDYSEQSAGTVHAYNPEHLPVFKDRRKDDPEQNAGTIHARGRGHTYNIQDQALGNVLWNAQFVSRM